MCVVVYSHCCGHFTRQISRVSCFDPFRVTAATYDSQDVCEMRKTYEMRETCEKKGHP